MYDRKNYIKRAFYHIMKMEMKKNKSIAYDGYKLDNEKLGQAFAKGKIFDNSIIFIENGTLHLAPDFFKLKFKERDAIIEYMCQNIND